ncbi:hypothetical protein [Ruminococcus albus]|uniref:hypothetical protein n=1 Tax=Ruminococcus albus TaxID=1264 RepID=UPI0012BCCADD|nr:hypothetical protein [Ruminococcus albus]
MKIKKVTTMLTCVSLIGACLSMTGCDGGAKHKDTKTSSTFVANCSGGDTVSGHSNKITLTQKSDGKKTVSVSDFYIDLVVEDCKVTASSNTTWSTQPKKGGTTTVNKLNYTIAGRKQTTNGTISWTSLDTDGDSKAEGDATFSTT